MAKGSYRTLRRRPRPEVPDLPSTIQHRKGSPRKRLPGQSEEAALRRLRCYNLRIAGKSYREIAEAEGINLRTAWEHVNAELQHIRAETQEMARDVRDADLKRLDLMLAAIWPSALGIAKDGTPKLPDVKAQQMVLSIMERKARLIGLDAPAKSMTIPWDKLTDDQVRQLAAGEDPFVVLHAVQQPPTETEAPTN